MHALSVGWVIRELVTARATSEEILGVRTAGEATRYSEAFGWLRASVRRLERDLEVARDDGAELAPDLQRAASELEQSVRAILADPIILHTLEIARPDELGRLQRALGGTA